MKAQKVVSPGMLKVTAPLLFLLCIFAFLIRLFPIVRFGPVIMEYDPHFNLRVAKYLDTHTLSEYLEWFDEKSWYPQGRHIGDTAYPGMMITSLVLKRLGAFFNADVDISEACVYSGIFFAIFSIFYTFLLGKALGSEKMGLIAAVIATFTPGQVQSSICGEYDYESLAISLTLAVIYHFMRSVSLNSSFHSILSSLFFIYLSWTWGGYVFAINLIPFFVIASVLCGNMSFQLYISYSVWFILVLIGLSSNPCVRELVFERPEHYMLFITLIFLNLERMLMFIRQKYGSIVYRKCLLRLFAAAVLIISILLYFNAIPWLNGRLLKIFSPWHIADRKELETLVVEHQPSTWSSYFVYCGPFLFLAPLGVFMCVSEISNESLMNSLLFMVPLVLSVSLTRIVRVLSYTYVFASALALDSLLRRIYKKRKWILVLSLFLFCVLTVNSTVYLSANEFSKNYINLEIETKDGVKASQDIQEAYEWIKQNTEKSAKVLSWWDMGYQISSMAQRTVLTDGNTNNMTHIAVIGLTYVLREYQSWKIMRSLDVDYVVVSFGGASGFRGDDMMKLQYTPTLVQQVFSNVSAASYQQTGNDIFNTGQSMSRATANSLLFKLSYNNFKRFKFNDKLPFGFDSMRGEVVPHLDFKLEYFEEVYTSENWLIRVYRVKGDKE